MNVDECRTFSFAASFDEDRGKFVRRTSWYVKRFSDDLSRKSTKWERSTKKSHTAKHGDGVTLSDEASNCASSRSALYLEKIQGQRTHVDNESLGG